MYQTFGGSGRDGGDFFFGRFAGQSVGQSVEPLCQTDEQTNEPAISAQLMPMVTSASAGVFFLRYKNGAGGLNFQVNPLRSWV